MLNAIKSLFSQYPKRIVALHYKNGEVEVFTEDNLNINSSVYDFVEDDLSLIGSVNNGIQFRKVDIYDGEGNVPEQTIYSIPYDKNKKPEFNNTVPKEIINVVWNYLEGAKGKDKENLFTLK